MLELGTWLLRTEAELVLKSRRVVPGRLLDDGFQFLFPAWPAAARELVGRWRGTHPVDGGAPRHPPYDS
jgi:NAD dependent epimerase/dehydratase family enzyme